MATFAPAARNSCAAIAGRVVPPQPLVLPRLPATWALCAKCGSGAKTARSRRRPAPDLKRCRLLAASVALIYNWWSLFVRLADPDHHREVITSRPLLLQAIARKTQHAGRTTLSVSSTHGEQRMARQAYLRIARFFARLREKAEQLDALQRWYRILSEALRKYLHGRQLIPPARLQPG